MDRRKLTRRPWTVEEDARLRSLAASGLLAYEIAEEMQRSIAAIWDKAKRAGVDIKIERKAAKRIVVTSRLEEAVRKAVRAEEAKQAMAEHDQKQAAIRENLQRLKAARLARDAGSDDKQAD